MTATGFARPIALATALLFGIAAARAAEPPKLRVGWAVVPAKYRAADGREERPRHA
jgi:hypothetical protein